MSYEMAPAKKDGSAGRPPITTYDSGYEHSLEHMAYVQGLVDEAAAEMQEPPAVRTGFPLAA